MYIFRIAFDYCPHLAHCTLHSSSQTYCISSRHKNAIHIAKWQTRLHPVNSLKKMQNSNSSYLPTQILIIHMSHKERFCGKSIRLHFYICSCNLKTRFIHTHLLKISCKQCIIIIINFLCYKKKLKTVILASLQELSIRKYVNGIQAILEKIIIFKSEIYCSFPFIPPGISFNPYSHI